MDQAFVEGALDPTCFNTCSAVPCVLGNTITDCAPAPNFAECGTIVSNFGLCLLFETSTGDQYFLDDYGTYAEGDQAFVEGTLDPGCFNTCAAVPCVFGNTITDCAPAPNFSECGMIVDNFGLCLVLETATGDRYNLDNFGTFGIGDLVLVEGTLDPGCFNICSANPCVFNNTIVACPFGGPQMMRGDCNDDGLTDIADAF